MNRLKFACTMAQAAGELTLKGFYDHHLRIDRKTDQTPVTESDLAAEKFMREQIAAAFPDDAVLGEEFPETEGNSGYQWILDPIDGTKSFICGVPLYSTLVGVLYNGVPCMGVIAIPVLGDLIWAEVGQKCWHRCPRHHAPTRAMVSFCESLAEATFLTSEVKTYSRRNRSYIYTSLEQETRLARTWGDGYGYFMVATGRADIMVDPELSPWDAGPLVPILTEAGGKFTDWKGNPTIHGGDGIGTNGFLHEQVLKLVRPQDRPNTLQDRNE